MKRTKTISLLIMLLIVIKLNAQASFGVVDIAKINKSVTTFMKADSLVQNMKIQYQLEYLQKQQNITALTKTVDSLEKSNKVQSRLNEFESKLQQNNEELNKWVQQSSNKLEEYQNLILKPYNDKLLEVIKTIAKRRKFKAIQDIASMIYVDPEIDITDEVIKKLTE